MAFVLYSAIAVLALWMAYSFVATAQILLAQPVLLVLAVAAGLVYLSLKR